MQGAEFGSAALKLGSKLRELHYGGGEATKGRTVGGRLAWRKGATEGFWRATSKRKDLLGLL